MKIEDYPPVEIEGQHYRRVPELAPYDEGDDCWCDLCAFRLRRDCSSVNEAASFQLATPDTCGDTDTIYLPEERFDEYVVEVVRRRIS